MSGTTGKGTTSEKLPLLAAKSELWYCRRRFFITHKCIRAKPALLVLVSSYPVTLLCMFLLYPHTYRYLTQTTIRFKYFGTVCSFVEAAVFCFYPLAGYLADVKVGRYRTILASFWMLLCGSVVFPVGVVAITAVLSQNGNQGWSAFVVFLTITSLVIGSGIILLMLSFIGIKANIIQYGLDQLYDSPTESQSLYVHWYVWTCYMALLTKNLAVSPTAVLNDKVTEWFYSFISAAYIVSLAVVIVSLVIYKRKKKWFHIDRFRFNPYSLVFKVRQFAYTHKVPLRRSAFTFCEDKLPTGLDLGKHKYGGPFTTEQVEDVKTFYGMLKVIMSLGPAFFLNAAANPSLAFSSSHLVSKSHASNNGSISLGAYNVITTVFFAGNVLYPLIITIIIPLYLVLLRPLLFYVTPGMLKRIFLGIFLLVLSLILTFVIDTLTHVGNNNMSCSLCESRHITTDASSTGVSSISPNLFYIKNVLLFLQTSLLAISNTLIYISIYEFICSQSPHFMKGLIIGVFFSLEGVFNFLGSIPLLSLALSWSKTSFPSCGMVLYAIQIAIGLLAMAVYGHAARSYKYRVRDEPCNVRIFVEDYYSNLQKQRLIHGSDSFKI